MLVICRFLQSSLFRAPPHPNKQSQRTNLPFQVSEGDVKRLSLATSDPGIESCVISIGISGRGSRRRPAPIVNVVLVVVFVVVVVLLVVAPSLMTTIALG